jgi:hypothetical protein
MDLFMDVCTDALLDSIKMIPLLFIIYFLIELAEVKFGNRVGHAVAKAGKAGPVAGALAGMIPQCGVSVVGTALYTQRLVTIGTLFAVYIATSDEAIPLILAQPDALPVLVPLLLTKLVAAIVVGYGIDIVFRKHNAQVFDHIEAYEEGTDSTSHDHSGAYTERGCCGHEPLAPNQKANAHTLFIHPLIHTLKIFLFIFAVSLLIGLLFEYVGEDTIANALAQVTILQPVVAALIGLIPNCAASVAITEFYLSGAITFGATIAGLCASGGLGLLVLLKEDQHTDAAKIIAGLLAISIVIGLIVEALGL